MANGVLSFLSFFYMPRRQLILLFIGFVFFLVGLSYLANPPAAASLVSYSFALHHGPLALWGACFVASGTLGILGSLMYRLTTVAFGVLTFYALTWAMMAGASQLVLHASRGYVAMLSWGCIAAVLLIVAGWTECQR